MPPLEVSPSELKQRLDAGERLHLIDVREPVEHALAQVATAELIPMGTVPSQLQSIEAYADDGPVIVICHHGVRSLNVVAWLRGQGVNNCQSLAGGIDRWSTDIDPAVPRY